MKCEICGNSYVRSCIRCTKRVMTWGEDGTQALMGLAKVNGPIDSKYLAWFVGRYYVGKSVTMSDKADTLRTALKILGYDGGYIGRVHENNVSYPAIRNREHSKATRYRLKKDTCDFCKSAESLILHHIIPLSWGGKSNEDNCLTLCEKCHKEVHLKLKQNLNRGLLLRYLEPHKEEIKKFALLSIVNELSGISG
jgi:5-methylcytosine-specific restriction endonuclease McrA